MTRFFKTDICYFLFGIVKKYMDPLYLIRLQFSILHGILQTRELEKQKPHYGCLALVLIVSETDV